MKGKNSIGIGVAPAPIDVGKKIDVGPFLKKVASGQVGVAEDKGSSGKVFFNLGLQGVGKSQVRLLVEGMFFDSGF